MRTRVGSNSAPVKETAPLSHTPSIGPDDRTCPKHLLDLVDDNTLRVNMQFLSNDLLEGRGVGTRGESLAAFYMSTFMQLHGLQVKVQEVPMVAKTSNTASLWFSKPNDISSSLPFFPLDHFLIGSDLESTSLDVSGADVVFVGYGIYAPEYNWNDYKNVDVSNKIVLCLVNEPSATSAPSLFNGEELTYYGRWTYKLEEARRRKALGVVLVHTEKSAGYPFSVLSSQQESVQLEGAVKNGLEVKIWINEEATERLLPLLCNCPHLPDEETCRCFQSVEDLFRVADSKDFQPQVLHLEMAANCMFELRQMKGTNVIGILKGTQENSNEHVIISAHHDHLGIGPAKNNDNIYNGAEDNASGSSMLLNTVKSLAESRPKRSIVFLSLTGEEHGLLGAFHYTSHPALPLSDAIAYINFDIGNLYGKTKDMVGLGSDKSEIGSLFAEMCKAEGLYVSADSNPSSGSFLRSDALAFAKAGVPSVYIWTGRDFEGQPEDYLQIQRSKYIKERYHQPNDEYSSNMSMDGLIQQVRVAVRLTYSLAHGSQRLKWFAKEQLGFG